MRYLLAAEADKIQDFIFRSSRLQEVVGASQLLNRFCREGALRLLEEHGGDPAQDVLVNDGGSFRILFAGDEAKDRASRFGGDLAELYRLSLGGTISVAEPVALDDDFKDAAKEANRALRRAKEHRQVTAAEPHMPYVAFCTSCGIGLADTYAKLPGEKNDRGRYLCAMCQTKAEERVNNRHDLLDEFLEIVIESEDHLDQFIWPEDTDAVANHDPRNYVAYLVADGNGIGNVFAECDEVQIRELSKQLTSALRRSLATPTGLIMRRLDRQFDKNKLEIVPVLPLILGGDDLFALIPAPYALDFAQRFCLIFERELKNLVEKEKLNVPNPTVAAAVVICKSKYPYTLAHSRAEELLKEAKRQSKLLATYCEQPLSAISFEIILGSRLAGQEEKDVEQSKVIRSSLKPYWVINKNTGLSDRAKEYGIALNVLLNQRLKLKDVPNKRLSELRRRFINLPRNISITEHHNQMTKWTHSLDSVIERSDHQAVLQEAMKALGQTSESNRSGHHWRELNRNGSTLLAHGMLDLLEAWEFAQDLDNGLEKYEPKEYESQESEQ
ncbi:MAG: hypothetical protein WAZ19_14870 [Anaerolineae bacterium]